MTSITTPYIYTENGVDSSGTTAADGGNFTFYGNAGGAQRGWFITFPTPIPNVTEVDFSTLSGTANNTTTNFCLLYTSPSPRDGLLSRMPSSA